MAYVSKSATGAKFDPTKNHPGQRQYVWGPFNRGLGVDTDSVWVPQGPGVLRWPNAPTEGDDPSACHLAWCSPYAKEEVLGIFVRANIFPDDDCAVRIGYVTPGQTLSNAISAEQWITESFELKNRDDGYRYEIPVLQASKVLETNIGLFLSVDALADSALEGVVFQMETIPYSL